MGRLKFHPAGDDRQRPRLRCVLPFGLLIQHAEKAFRAGHGHECLVQLVPDGLDRVKKQVRQEEKHDQVAHLHVQPAVPAQRAKRPQQRHGPEE